MNAAELPSWAQPYHGESIASWRDATGGLLPICHQAWVAMWNASATEPEYPAPNARYPWKDLPACLGDIRTIPVAWRLVPEQRHVYCQGCVVDHATIRRWPTCVPWLDARRIKCALHDALLCYRTVPEFVLAGPDIRSFLPEIIELLAWLEEWMLMEQQQQESLWRRDLVSVAMRNWNKVSDVAAYSVVGWELRNAGWLLPGEAPHNMPNRPTRLGSLAPRPRISALLTAFRYGRRLDGQTKSEKVSIDSRGLDWLSRRWKRRAPASRFRRLTRWLAEADEERRLRRTSEFCTLNSTPISK